MKNNIIYNILKSFYFIKGCIKVLFFKKDKIYHGGINNCACQYIGKRTFYETQSKGGLGFLVYDKRQRTYPLWQIGMLKFK